LANSGIDGNRCFLLLICFLSVVKFHKTVHLAVVAGISWRKTLAGNAEALGKIVFNLAS
jgi:hypothetical protein